MKAMTAIWFFCHVEEERPLVGAALAQAGIPEEEARVSPSVPLSWVSNGEYRLEDGREMRVEFVIPCDQMERVVGVLKERLGEQHPVYVNNISVF